MREQLFSAAERTAMGLGVLILAGVFFTLGEASPSPAQWAGVVVGLVLIAAPLLAMALAPEPRRPSLPFGE